jgi:signal transduction histidine kinase
MKGPINKNYLLPGWSMVWASIFCLILMGSAFWILTQQPWLGVKLSLGEKGTITVQHVYENSPAQGRLKEGDVLVALLNDESVPFQLKPIDLQDDYSDLPTFAEFRLATHRQERITQLLRGKQINVLLQSDKVVTLEPSERRPLSSIPISFWVVIFAGCISLLISFMTWRLRSGIVATRIFLVCGIGLTICAWASAIFVFRELALGETFLVALTKLSVFGAELTAFSCSALIWSYPKSIARFPVVPLIFTFVILDGFRIFFEIAEGPGHSFVVGIILAVPLGVVFSVIQWRNAAGKPDDKAVLKWVNLSIYTAVITVMVLYFLPILMHRPPVVDITLAFIIMLFVFLGFAFAIARYRLFDIERWWSDIWLWFFAGLTIVIADLALVLFANINQGIALTAILLLVGWIYFPLRQRLWSKVFRYRENHLEDYLPKIAEALTGMSGDVERLWRGLLQEIFQPLAIENLEYAGKVPSILEGGLVLAVPGGHEEQVLQLRLAARGRRLFLHEDVKLSAALFHLVFGKHHSIASYMKGAQAERQRIVRDLHDDVAGKLLAMKLISPEARHADLADDALKALRSVIYSLDSSKGMSLQEAVIRWKADMSERCEASGIELEFSLQGGLEEFMLTPRQMLNYERIIHEGVTNAIVHSSANKLCINIRLCGEELVVELINDGNVGEDDQHPGQGIGLLNIAQRMSEMGGRMEYNDDRENGVFQLCCVNPIGGGNAEDTGG